MQVGTPFLFFSIDFGTVDDFVKGFSTFGASVFMVDLVGLADVFGIDFTVSGEVGDVIIDDLRDIDELVEVLRHGDGDDGGCFGFDGFDC